jgi:acid phosphatase type 7
MKRFIQLLIILSIVSLFAEEPLAVFLTWEDNPSTSMVVTWITSPNEKTNKLSYQPAGKGDWDEVGSVEQPFPLDFPYTIHKARLTNLKPETEYRFKTDNENNEWRFRTLPNDPTSELKFIIGGDLYNGHNSDFIEAARTSAAQSPQFAVIGGDIAYAHERKLFKERKKTKRERWIKWIKLWTKEMVTPEGYMIPIVPVIGNHDTIGHYNQTPRQSPIYYALFPTPNSQGYDVLDIGQHVSLITLDSGHTHAISGRQSLWLEAVLKQRRSIPHTLAVYHVPAYPAARKLSSRRGTLIRKYWTPIFDRHNLTAAFEHHEHTYKRTHPLRHHTIDPNGVIYLGNGGWGVKNIRTPKNTDKKWYLAKAMPKQHFILVTIKDRSRLFQAIDMQGTIFDHYQAEAPAVK